jgi:hypothetical protein
MACTTGQLAFTISDIEEACPRVSRDMARVTLRSMKAEGLSGSALISNGFAIFAATVAHYGQNFPNELTQKRKRFTKEMLAGIIRRDSR